MVLIGIALVAFALWWSTRDRPLQDLRELAQGEIVEVLYDSPSRESFVLREATCIAAIKRWLAHAHRPGVASWPATNYAMTLRYRDGGEVEVRVSRMDGSFVSEDARRYAMIGFRGELFIAEDPPDTACAIATQSERDQQNE